MQTIEYVGTLILENNKSFIKYHACGAFYDTILVKAGEYPIHGKIFNFAKTLDYIFAEVPGEIIKTKNHNFIYGDLLTYCKNDTHVIYNWKMQCSRVAYDILNKNNNNSLNIQLNKDFIPQKYIFKHNNKQITNYCIFMDKYEIDSIHTIKVKDQNEKLCYQIIKQVDENTRKRISIIRK